MAAGERLWTEMNEHKLSQDPADGPMRWAAIRRALAPLPTARHTQPDARRPAVRPPLGRPGLRCRVTDGEGGMSHAQANFRHNAK